MAYLKSTDCCGIRELVGVCSGKAPEELLQDAADDWFRKDRDGAFMFFSCLAKHDHGTDLMEYIQKHKLGQVFRAPAMRNPNSRHMLSMFMWAVDKERWADWDRAHRKPKQAPEAAWYIMAGLNAGTQAVVAGPQRWGVGMRVRARGTGSNNFTGTIIRFGQVRFGQDRHAPYAVVERDNDWTGAPWTCRIDNNGIRAAAGAWDGVTYLERI